MSTVQGVFLQLKREEHHLIVRGHVETGQFHHSTSTQSPLDDGCLAPTLRQTLHQITNPGNRTLPILISRPPTMLRESNAFSRACLLVCSQGSPHVTTPDYALISHRSHRPPPSGPTLAANPYEASP